MEENSYLSFRSLAHIVLLGIVLALITVLCAAASTGKIMLVIGLTIAVLVALIALAAIIMKR